MIPINIPAASNPPIARMEKSHLGNEPFLELFISTSILADNLIGCPLKCDSGQRSALLTSERKDEIDFPTNFYRIPIDLSSTERLISQVAGKKPVSMGKNIAYNYVMSKQIKIKSELQRNWRSSLLMGVAASIFSLMVGILLQTAFYEIANNIPAVVRQDAHIALPLCKLFPDLYGCDAWVGLLTSLEIWELSQHVGQISGLLSNLVLVTIFSIWVTIRTQRDNLVPGLLIGVAGFFFSLILALVVQVPLSIHIPLGVLGILLLLFLPLCGFAGGRIGIAKLSGQAPQTSVYFFPVTNEGKIDGTPENLSDRELEVLVLVAEGFKNHEIAQQLYISNATVKTHLQHIFSKLGVSNRTAAVTQALACGFLRQETASDEDMNIPK